MVTVNDILIALESFAPAHLKMDWDNVGLLVGGKNREVTKVLVALDPFEGVCKEAARWGAELIVTHHPLIFRPISAITDDTALGRSIQLLCREGISAVNAHTNLDCAPGGVNDLLAQRLGLENIQVIGQENLLREGFTEEMPLDAFLGRVKKALGCEGLRYVSGEKPVRHVAVGGGACASELMDAVNAGCDTFVTSDVKYNQFWDARDLGLNLIDAGHFHTENPATAYLAEKIAAAFPEIQVKISESHADCMGYYR